MEEDVVRHYPLKETIKIDNLTPFVSDIEIIPIENDSLCISGTRKIVATSDRYFLLSGGVMFSLLKDGQNIKKIGRVGRGPGEYISITDFALSTDEKEIWCLDALNDVLRYKIETGEFVDRVKIDNSKVVNPHGIIPISNDEFAIYVSNPEDMLDHVGPFYCLHKFNLQGREIDKGLKWFDFNPSASFMKVVSISDHGQYTLSPESSQPSLVFESGKVVKKLYFDFEELNVPSQYAFKDYQTPWESIAEMFESKYYKLVSSVFFPDRYIYFTAYGLDSSLWNFLMSCDGGKGIRWQSIGVHTPTVPAIGIEEDSLFFPFDDYGMTDEKEKDPLKVMIVEKYGKPDIPTHVLIKIKFDV